MKKALILLIALLCVSLLGCSQQVVCNCTCGADTATAATVPTTEGTTAVEATVSHEVDTIDLTGKNGSIRFEGTQPATAALLEPNAENYKDGDAVLVEFTFTLTQSLPAKCKDIFEITYYQNGVQVRDDLWTSSAGGKQYDLCGNYHLELLNGSSITFARPIPINGTSPLTVMVTDLSDPDNYQIMVVDIAP